MPTDDPFPQPPVEPPPDLLARARSARVMLLFVGLAMAGLGSLSLVRIVLRSVAPSVYMPIGGSTLGGLLFLAAGIGLSLGKPTYRRSAYWLLTVVGFLEATIGGEYLVSLASTSGGASHHWPPGSPQVLLAEGVFSLITGIVLILCGNLLTTPAAVFEADVAGMSDDEPAVRNAFKAAPPAVLARLADEGWQLRLRWRPLAKLALGLTAAVVFLAPTTALMNRDPGPTKADWSHARARLAEIAASGDTIAPLLAQYHAHHGKYPPWLGALDHDQLHLLPPQPAEATDPWDYSLLNDGHDYQISVILPRDIWPGGSGYRAVLCYRSDGH
jgi:hypothetical protein